MELFSEVYGCYYSVVARILEQARNGMSKAEIEKFVNDNAFYDSAFYLLPKLFSGEWDLIENKQGRFYSKLQAKDTKRPLTILEKAWLKSLLSDKRIMLFASKEELKSLEKELSQVAPLFYSQDFYIFDTAADGDPYEDLNYRENFKKILQALNTKSAIIVDYESGKQNRLTKHIFPYKINYSNRDDKFRLLAILPQKGERYKRITLNIARIISVQKSDRVFSDKFGTENFYKITGLDDSGCMEGSLAKQKGQPIILEVSKERNALERCMLQFASWERQTEYDEEKGSYICRIFYDKQEETELLIRILSFGPVVRVLGPESFLRQIKERIIKQIELNNKENKI